MRFSLDGAYHYEDATRGENKVFYSRGFMQSVLAYIYNPSYSRGRVQEKCE
jgi:hypothetical protein